MNASYPIFITSQINFISKIIKKLVDIFITFFAESIFFILFVSIIAPVILLMKGIDSLVYYSVKIFGKNK
jgi:hypothetical protein